MAKKLITFSEDSAKRIADTVRRVAGEPLSTPRTDRQYPSYTTRGHGFGRTTISTDWPTYPSISDGADSYVVRIEEWQFTEEPGCQVVRTIQTDMYVVAHLAQTICCEERSFVTEGTPVKVWPVHTRKGVRWWFEPIEGCDTESSPCPDVYLFETDIFCESGRLNVYKRGVIIDYNGTCWTVDRGEWLLDHTAGCCDCDSSSSSDSSSDSSDSSSDSSDSSSDSSDSSESSSPPACYGSCLWEAQDVESSGASSESSVDCDSSTCASDDCFWVAETNSLGFVAWTVDTPCVNSECGCYYPNAIPDYEGQTIQGTCGCGCGRCAYMRVAQYPYWQAIGGCADYTCTCPPITLDHTQYNPGTIAVYDCTE